MRRDDRRQRRAWAAAALVFLAACADGRSGELDPRLPDAGVDDMARGTQLLAPDSALPTRAEVVALTDRLAIAASKAKAASTEEPTSTQMLWVAARLRERLWRLDGSVTDAREAMELYRQVLKEGGSDVSCEADWRQARLAGEVEHDAALAYRELFLATERQAAGEKSDAAAEACLARLRAMLSRVELFKPTGTAWQALQQEGAELAVAPPSGGGAPPSASGSGAPLSHPPREGFTGSEVIVKPDPSMLGKEAPTLTKVQPYSWKRGGRIVLELTGPATYSTGLLKPDAATGKGHRIYVDIENVRVQGKKHRTLDADGLIEQVRMATRGNGVRVVLDLKQQVHRRVFYLPNPFRVMIDVGVPNDPPPAASAPPAGKRLVRRVTLDPGHGGWDAGAVGPTGLREKDVALDVAHRAAPALAAELGVETMLTRDNDAFIELEERTARANAFQSDLFISVHCNATENGEAQGHEIFILDPSRDGDRRAYGALLRENRSKNGIVLDPSAIDAQVSSIAAGLGLGSYTKGSNVFAGLLQKSVHASLATRYPGSHDHGVKTAGFYVLVGAQMPAVLFETAFISNPEDEARLSTADYRQKMADAIVNAVRAYRDGL